MHVIVALADNEHQGIVPVPKALGNGDDPAHNLYWGAAFGVRTFLKKSSDWKEIRVFEHPSANVLQRSIFVHRDGRTYLVADAYRGQKIRAAIEDFFRIAAGQEPDITNGSVNGMVRSPKATLAVYVGHDGLMDFSLPKTFEGNRDHQRAVIILACASKSYFSAGLRSTGSDPLLWTTGLMAPEAYTLKAALDGWIAEEAPAQIQKRAAEAYAKYQKISLNAAQRLFSSDW